RAPTAVDSVSNEPSLASRYKATSRSPNRRSTPQAPPAAAPSASGTPQDQPRAPSRRNHQPTRLATRANPAPAQSPASTERTISGVRTLRAQRRKLRRKAMGSGLFAGMAKR